MVLLNSCDNVTDHHIGDKMISNKTSRDNKINVVVEYQINSKGKPLLIYTLIHTLKSSIDYIYYNKNYVVDEESYKHLTKLKHLWSVFYDDKKETLEKQILDYYTSRGFIYVDYDGLLDILDSSEITLLSTGDAHRWFDKLFPMLTFYKAYTQGKSWDWIEEIKVEYNSLNRLAPTELNNFRQAIFSLEARIKDIVARYAIIDLKTDPDWRKMAEYFVDQLEEPLDN
jgi:hypothetical protein